MKFILLAMVASLAAMFLYPVVLDLGRRVAKEFKSIQEKIDNDQTL